MSQRSQTSSLLFHHQRRHAIPWLSQQAVTGAVTSIVSGASQPSTSGEGWLLLRLSLSRALELTSSVTSKGDLSVPKLLIFHCFSHNRKIYFPINRNCRCKCHYAQLFHRRPPLEKEYLICGTSLPWFKLSSERNSQQIYFLFLSSFFLFLFQLNMFYI